MIMTKESFDTAKGTLSNLIGVLLEYSNSEEITDTHEKYRDVVHTFSVILKFHEHIADLEIDKRIKILEDLAGVR